MSLRASRAEARRSPRRVRAGTAGVGDRRRARRPAALRSQTGREAPRARRARRRHRPAGRRACARLADQLRCRTVGWNSREDRAADREVLEDLPRQHALATAACVRDQEEQRLRVALKRERGRARRVGISSSRSPRPSRSAHSRSAERKSPRNRAIDVESGVGERLQKRLRVSLAEEASGMSDPEARRRCVAEPCDIVEVAPVRDRDDPAARREAPHLVCDRIGDARDGVGASRHEPCHALVDPLLRAHRRRSRRAGADARTRESRRSASHFAPVARCTAAPTKWMELGGRGRDHRVDPLAARDPDRSRNRGQVPAHVLVGDEQAPRREPRLGREQRQPCLAVELLGRLASLRAEVARPVHPRLRRHAQPFVAVDPLRVVGSENVGLDAERRQVLGELERTLNAAAARRREVQRDEQHLHAGDGTEVRARYGRTSGNPGSRRRRHVHRCGAPDQRRLAHGESADVTPAGRIRAGGGCCGRRAGHGRALPSRNDSRHQRAARAAWRANGVRGDRGLRASPPPATPEPSSTSTGFAPTTRRRSFRSSGASASAAAWGPTASSRRSISRRFPISATPRQSRSAFCTPTGTPSTSAPSQTSSAGAIPRAHVVASHEAAPEFREYERASTTTVDAYLGPLLGGYLGELASACAWGGTAPSRS